ncbi:hypothetical protein AF086_14800, partial [Listeria monocytogenes]|nr:hypothetical protein [Listeria monocytogenes]
MIARNKYTITEVNLSDETFEEKCFYFREQDTIKKFKREANSMCEFKLLDAHMGQKSSDLLAVFLEETTSLCIQDCKENSKNFFISIIDYLFKFAEINYGSPIKGALSYCSHSEGYFTLLKNDKQKKVSFEKIFTENKDSLDDCYKNYLFNNQKKYQVLQLVIDKVKEELIEHIPNKKVYFYEVQDNNANLDGLLLRSEFHMNMNQNKKFIKMTKDLNFQKLRFITIMVYYFFKNLGLTNTERYLMCYLAYRTIEINENVLLKNE